MTDVHGEGATHWDTWMRVHVLMAFRQVHFIPDPFAHIRQHLQDLVPRHSWLAQLPQYHRPSPSSSTLLRVSSHAPSGRAGKGVLKPGWVGGGSTGHPGRWEPSLNGRDHSPLCGMGSEAPSGP